MNDRQYGELLQAILDLRQATERGFNDVYRRFDQQEERWNRRFNALENRVDDGFRQMEDRMSPRFDQLDERVGALEFRISGSA